jgi:hypothetical protein
MPRHRHRRRTMKGGFWDSLTQAWEKTKKASSDAYSSATGSTSTPLPPASSTPPPPTSTSTGYMGGRTKRRRMRGGFKDNTSTTGLASRAALFSGQTAQPHNLVGGRTKRRHRKHRHTKSCRHRR